MLSATWKFAFCVVACKPLTVMHNRYEIEGGLRNSLVGMLYEGEHALCSVQAGTTSSSGQIPDRVL